MDVNFKSDIEMVDIDAVRANPWNPRKSNEKRLVADARKHIEEVGFIGAIFVRPMPEGQPWQIIDGEHRYKALREMGATQCPIINLGEMSDEEAKVLTLNFNVVHGEMNVVDVALLIANLKDSMGEAIAAGRLAMDEQELADLGEMARFSYEDFKNDTPPMPLEVHVFRLNGRQNDLLNRALEKAEKQGARGTISRKLELVCADYLAGPDALIHPDEDSGADEPAPH